MEDLKEQENEWRLCFSKSLLMLSSSSELNNLALLGYISVSNLRQNLLSTASL